MSERLNMTIEQMEEEIIFMRNFYKWLEKNLEGYSKICDEYCLQISCNWLEENGVDSREFREMMEGKVVEN